MTTAELLALAQRLRDQAATLAPNATREDMLEAARYLRACAGAEPVATVRVHDTGGNAGIAWTGVPTENAGVMRGGTPLYEHPQPPSTQAEPVAWRITDGEGGYDYRDDPPEDWQVAWVARWGRKHEPLYTQPHPQPPSAQNARPLSEWHEDDGPVVWWLFPVHEPAWIGTPLDTDWPGYHTHWTPHPAAPATLAETSR